MENDLLGDQGGQTPDQTTPEPPAAGQESGDGGVNEVQKLTGQLTQKMRELTGQMQPTDYKSVINSIISAIDMSQFSEHDRNDMIKKIKHQANKSTEPAQGQAPAEMNEYGEQYGFENDEFGNDWGQIGRASGGQTIGEDAINERLELIIKKAKANVFKK